MWTMIRTIEHLSELSLQELWELFPIMLTAHNPQWKVWFEEEEKEALERLLPACDTVRIAHVGSTAIETIWAKPIVDILVEMKPDGDHDELYFRDYMREHPGAAKEYEARKLELWKQYEHDRDAYTEGKTEIVKRYTEDAKAVYGGRYEPGAPRKE